VFQVSPVKLLWQTLALSMWCWFSWHAECESYRAMEASTEISKESLSSGIRVPVSSCWQGDVWCCENQVKVAMKTPGSLKCQEHGTPVLGNEHTAFPRERPHEQQPARP
jgi:hypothetical protein